MRSRPLIPVLLVAFTYTFMWQFYTTWFASYLTERHGFTLQQATKYAGLPFVIGLVASWAGGLLKDLLAKRFEVRRARCSAGFVSLLIAAALLGLGVFCAYRRTAAILIAVGGAVGDLHAENCRADKFCAHVRLGREIFRQRPGIMGSTKGN